MRFLMLHRAEERGTPPTEEEMATMGKFMDESVKAGVLLATDGLLPSALGARVRSEGDGFTVTDGPFTEAKEAIGGFAIIRADSKEAAIEHAKEFLTLVGGGETEVRQMPDDPAYPPAS